MHVELVYDYTQYELSTAYTTQAALRRRRRCRTISTWTHYDDNYGTWDYTQYCFCCRVNVVDHLCRND